MIDSAHRLRVAMVAGTLGKGGAEKQLVFMVRALQQAGVDVRVYCATRGEFHESTLTDSGCTPIWYGRRASPLSRVLSLTRLLRKFRPHVIQSAHFYTNLYVALSARAVPALAFGSLRNDAVIEVQSNGRWGRWLIRLPPSLIANSQLAKTNAAQFGVDHDRIHVLSNVIDLDDFDRRAGVGLAAQRDQSDGLETDVPTVITVCRLVAAKRVDRFLDALQLANRRTPLRGIIVGDGPERTALQNRAADLGLTPETVRLVGWRDDVPALLRRSDLLAISSDHEGFPNVLLEAMAAGIPAVSTPAGDAPRVLDDTVTGFVVSPDAPSEMAQRMVQLATDRSLRTKMGSAARHRVERIYSPAGLADRMMQIYREAAVFQGRNAIEPLMSI